MFGVDLEKGDLDDTVNCFYLAEQCKQLTIYIVNDTGDGRRHRSFCEKYERLLKITCPGIQIVTGNIDLTDTTKVILCAPLHPLHDAVMIAQLRMYRPTCSYYAQGDTPGAYNMNGSALTPFLTFGEKPTLATMDSMGEPHLVPISLYNTASTNRKFTMDQIRKFVPTSVLYDMIIYSKHKLCFLPSKPFAIGLLMKKYGTGNTSYGLCHTMNLMDLDDLRDPDVVISEYLSKKYGEGHVERVLHTYPAVQSYIETMKTYGKLDSEEDLNIFKRAMMLVVECTILWFGEHALDRFRSLADSDIIASVTGTEKYSTSMFDLVVGIAVLNDITPSQLACFPGTANQLATGRLLTMIGV
jgi:hypothetical protein